MSYEKINFKNREVEKPLTFKKHVNDDGTITLEPKPGTIVEPGTPLLADHFNHMDDGIYKAHEEIDNLKLSGIERNKELVANLNSKKVSATTNDSLKTNIAKVKDIKLGSGNAVTSDVLQGKTFSSSQGTDLTGTMPNRGLLNKTLTTQGGQQTISPGYYTGGAVKSEFANLVPENIKKGVNVGGVSGAYTGEDIESADVESGIFKGIDSGNGTLSRTVKVSRPIKAISLTVATVSVNEDRKPTITSCEGIVSNKQPGTTVLNATSAFRGIVMTAEVTGNTAIITAVTSDRYYFNTTNCASYDIYY